MIVAVLNARSFKQSTNMLLAKKLSKIGVAMSRALIFISKSFELTKPELN